MNYIKSKWRTVTLILLVVCYILFIFIMNKRLDYLYIAGVIYLLVTTLLFFGTIIGIPGLILHSLFKKERLAIPFYALALKLGTRNTNILTAYGLIELRNFKPEAALDTFELAKSTTKHFFYHKTLTANIALCQWKMGQISEAAKTYEDLYYYPDIEQIEDYSLDTLSMGSDKNANFFAQDFVTMGYLFFLNGDMEKALYFTHIAILKMENYGPAYDNLGQIAYVKGDYVKAKQQFIKGLDYKPGMTDSLFYLTKIAIKEKNINDANLYSSQLDVSKINGLSTITPEDIKIIRGEIASLKS